MLPFPKLNLYYAILFIPVFNQRIRVKSKLHSWIRQNCKQSSGTWPIVCHLAELINSDCWSDGSLIREIGQSLDPEPHVENPWPESDLHVGQTCILRRLHISPVCEWLSGIQIFIDLNYLFSLFEQRAKILPMAISTIRDRQRNRAGGNGRTVFREKETWMNLKSTD